jgi:hypothetical protein
MKRLDWMFAVPILFLWSQASSLRAGITCSAADYEGTYAFSSVGSLITLPPAGAPLLGTIAQSGTFNPDGQGNLIIDTNASYNGIVLPGSVPAKYTVTPDCILTFSLTLPPPLSVPTTFTGVLSLDNRHMVLMITDPPGTLVVGEHYKQDSHFCGIADFSGAYQVDIGGTIIAPKDKAGQFHQIGRLVADGNGNFTASTFTNYNGNVVPETFDGTYEVNVRCYVTMTYTAGSGLTSQTITINGAFGGHGEILPVMILTPGYSVAGVLRAQQ